MYDLVTYLIVTCNDDTDVRVAQRVIHRKYLYVTVTFFGDIREVNIVTST